MTVRSRPDDPVWICCCCGCLPILGMIKGAIIVVPILILNIIGFTGISIILLPHDFVLTYRMLFKTKIIGINIKIICMLILPIALISWPILIFFSSALFGIFYGLFCPILRTFDSNYDLLLGGFIDVFQDTFKYIGYFWDFNYNSYFNYLFEIENKKVEKPFDFSIMEIIIGLLLACYGAFFGIIFFSLMWIIKCIPSIIKMYNKLCETYWELECLLQFMFLIIYVIAFVFVPIVGLLSILLYIGVGLYSGIFCAIDGYKYNIRSGLIRIWEEINKFDRSTNKIIFNRDFSFFPDCRNKHLKYNYD